MKRLSKLFSGQAPQSQMLALPVPDAPVCLVGDIHGRLDLLDRLMAQVAAAGKVRLIFLGDYIDRGPDSAGVLRRLMAMEAVCLMGNHERMLLDFLDRPAAAGERWLRNGGGDMVASFGILGRLPGDGPAARMEGLADRVREALPEGAEAWLRALPLWWREGGLAAVHAGADPALPIEAQPEQALLWGHRDFGRPRADGLWVGHGHVIVKEAKAEGGRISVDTGAWRTGKLTGAWIEGGEVRFLQT